MRGSSVPDSNYQPVHDSAGKNSPVLKHGRAPLKFLAVYGVAIVNGAALLYILLSIMRGIRRLLDGL
jgi:hypothetical protein